MSTRRKLGYDELVAKYVGLLSVLERPDTQRYSVQALLGLKLLMLGKIGIASEIFREIGFIRQPLPRLVTRWVEW